MKVLIIGAKGMLGQELTKVFEKQYEVVPWDKEDIDITQEQQVGYKISELKPDLIINAAAYNNVDGAEDDTEVADQVNGYAVGYLAKIAKEIDVPVVHYSTEYVFGGEKKEGYVEEDVPNPISAYGNSKYLGEKELRSNTDKYYLIRLSRLFGKPAQSKYAKKSFVDIMLDLAEQHDQLEVVDEEYSSPTYAPDLAVFTKNLVDSNVAFGIYHGANEGACTWHGFAKQIFAEKHKNVKLIPVEASHFERPAKRPKYGELLNTKISKQRTWQEALADYLNPDN